MTAEEAARVAPEERLLNRELSRLDFDARVLALAADRTLPLLERVKFCAIFSSNLDELFMVRVAGLVEQLETGVPVRSPDGRLPQQTLSEIRARVEALTARQSRLWVDELRPALAEHGVLVGGVEDCTAKELVELGGRFEREVYPVLTPLAVGPGQPFPFISPLSLSLGVFVRDGKTGDERFARVKVPETLPRFVCIGRRRLYLPLEEVIAHFLDRLFPQMEILEHAAFRVTRDADFEVSDEADDLLEAVRSELRRRRFGHVVRLEVSASASEALRGRLVEGLPVPSGNVYDIAGPLDLADLTQLAELDRPDLKDEPWVPVVPRRFADAVEPRDLFAEIRRGDILVHHPYDSFAGTFEVFMRAAAEDPDVIALKTTVYRTSDDSPLVPALVEAAEDGKQAVCLVELKARFDEHRNIEWSRALERAGVHVVHGFPHLKIHCKATLVVRREPDGLRRYVHVGTGNYNSRTARLYEDFGLFTADPAIASDVADLFNYLTGFGRPQRFGKVLAAPLGRLVDGIRAVAQAAADGRRGRIRIKTNNLTDRAIVEELYAASQAGATVDVVARSTCALRPGVPGLSENVRVRSVVGRFLEHSRLYVFEAGDETVYLLGSADLMPRNLDHRVELVVPIGEQRLQARLDATFAALLDDNTNGWTLGPDGAWRRLQPGKGERARAAHAQLMRAALRRRSRADGHRVAAGV